MAILLEHASVGETVIVLKEQSECFDMIGIICKVSAYDGKVRVSVDFEGEVFSFSLDDLAMA